VDSWPVIERYPAGKGVNMYPGKILWKTKHCFASVSPSCGFLRNHQVFIRLYSHVNVMLSWIVLATVYKWHFIGELEGTRCIICKIQDISETKKCTHKRHSMSKLFLLDPCIWTKERLCQK
jgi:hypothetical protein